MSRLTGLVTAEELEKFPDDDYRYELVEGRVIRMSPVGFEHGEAVAALMGLLVAHLRDHGLGSAVTEVGFKLSSNPDTVRAPDVAFVRRERIVRPRPKGFWPGPPDLAVEVLSPDDRPSDVGEKVQEYLTHGVPLVIVIDPGARTATVYRPHSAEQLLTEDDVLDLGEVVPGFRCNLRDALPEA